MMYYTIIIYWNKTAFTRYEHVGSTSFSSFNGWFVIDIGSGRTLRIPSTTINRIETIREDP